MSAFGRASDWADDLIEETCTQAARTEIPRETMLRAFIWRAERKLREMIPPPGRVSVVTYRGRRRDMKIMVQADLWQKISPGFSRNVDTEYADRYRDDPDFTVTDT